LTKKTNLFWLINSEDSNKKIRVRYEGSYLKGNVYLSFENLPPFEKFYLQLGQTFGPFEESDSLTVHPPKPLKLPLSQVVTLVPCYNVEKYCKEVIESCLNYSEKILIIDDGSTDGTQAILKEIAHKYPSQIIFLINEVNQGKGSTLLRGFQHALDHIPFKALIAIDSDAQHKPSDIPKLASAILDGEEFVIGSRTFRLMPFKNRIANTLITIFLRRVFPHAPTDTQSGYRAFSKGCLKDMTPSVKGARFEMEFDCLLYALDKKKRIRSIPISTIYIDKNKSSSFSSIRDSFRIFKVLFQYGSKSFKK
jgi:glycosyltransferase involved in cell wall biosynthesis